MPFSWMLSAALRADAQFRSDLRHIFRRLQRNLQLHEQKVGLLDGRTRFVDILDGEISDRPLCNGDVLLTQGIGHDQPDAGGKVGIGKDVIQRDALGLVEFQRLFPEQVVADLGDE